MILNLEFYTSLKYHIIVGAEYDIRRYVKISKNLPLSYPY